MLILVGSDAWVFLDAQAHEQRGEPVVVTFGRYTLRSPGDWCLVCLVLWVLFFPLYMIARRG